MARKRKGQALNDCPKDLNDIPYIRWMNQQIASGRHPRGLSAPPVLDGQGSTAQSPTAAPSRVRRQPAKTAATQRPVVEQYDDDADDDDREEGDDSDHEEEEPEDQGMSPSDDDDDEDAEEDSPEEAQPVAPPPKRRAARKQGGVNALQKQWRKLTLLWREYKRADGGSGNGSVEKPPLYPYMELHNQDTAAAAPHAVDGGGATNVNVLAGMEVPTSSQPSTSTPCFTAPPPTNTATPKPARVHETATMQAAMLVSATIKDCHDDAMRVVEGLVREWMAQDLRLARERMTKSAPPDVHRAPPDFSPPPPRGESAPPPEAAQPREDMGDVNTVTPADEDVEIWVRGAAD
ncbi:unnamed protein product [Closterium sp. NIES-64]|nr:unnamed protein product [Closterium sp. NIES-64]